jgi:RimJ/RimL family protein N-acetyltransferase
MPPDVSLRRFEPGDAGAVHRWFNNQRATRTLVVQRPSFSIGEAEEWVARAMDDSGDDRKYAIVVVGFEEPVGFTALYGLSREGGPELGALIGDEVRRSGVGRRAEALTIARAFDELGAHRVYGEIPAFNEAAKRTVKSLGWQFVETLADHDERGGERFDLEIWDVSPDDFRAAAADILPERGAERTSKSDSS